MNPIGKTHWVIPGGHIPLCSIGREPNFTSRDVVAILNAGDTDAQVVMTVYYADRDPVEGYSVEIRARRVRKVTVNALIDPVAIPLDVDYALEITSDVPVVVQFLRQDTSLGMNAMTGTIAYGE
jgi:hypothetical protein